MDSSNSARCTITRDVVFEIWRNSRRGDYIKKVVAHFMERYNVIKCDKAVLRKLNAKISTLCYKIKQKWNASSRHYALFRKNNKAWLEGEINLPTEFLQLVPSTSSSETARKTPGRPEKEFGLCSPRVQKRKVKEIVNQKSTQEIALAAEISLRASGKRDAAVIVKELAASSPKRATKLKNARKMLSVRKRMMTPEEALALVINNKLSTHQYKSIRSQVKSLGHSVYPTYRLVKLEKQKCYPPSTAIVITDSSAEVNLQDLLDLTAKRISIVQEEVMTQFCTSDNSSLTLITKWGCDGSSGQSRYKQKLKGGDSDEHLFTISCVPIQLVSGKSIIWQNKRPSSTRYCRVVSFTYKKETKELIQHEIKRIQDKIKNLQPTIVHVSENEVEISHKMILTMVDGKICSALSQYSSSQTCYICGASPKEMNDEKKLKKKVPQEEMYEFGISPLHSWIRAFEFILHLSYKTGIKKWQARSAEEKSIVLNKKLEIQERFRNELGILVDMPKQSAGNTNDGNTARRFFKNPRITAEITQVDENLIYHLKIILEALASGFEIDSGKFEKFAEETRTIYFENYKWYYMPASIHKILFHGKEIIKNCIIPIGQLSEEAQEARNKDYRQYREFFARKTSRQDTNRDILNRFLLSSDPVISNYQATSPNKSSNTFCSDTIKLFKCVNPDDFITDNDDSSDTSDSE